MYLAKANRFYCNKNMFLILTDEHSLHNLYKIFTIFLELIVKMKEKKRSNMLYHC